MPYLFEARITAILNRRPGFQDAQELATKCRDHTARLLLHHPLPGGYAADDQVASNLVSSMGSRSRRDRGAVPANAPHASDPGFVGNDWVNVSNNAQHIVGMVSAELAYAFNLGLDIRSPEVIGTMYKLAVRVWSLDEYTGYVQDEGRR